MTAATTTDTSHSGTASRPQPHDLPSRAGPRPRTTPWTPHHQQDQNAPPAMRDALAARVFALAEVEERATLVSGDGARAIWLRDSLPPGPADAFLQEREVGHFHVWDGSLHVALPPALAAAAVAAGWAEPHPIVRAGLAPEHFVMLYGPRDEHEADVLFELIAAAVRRAAGRDAVAPPERPRADRDARRQPSQPQRLRQPRWRREPQGGGR